MGLTDRNLLRFDRSTTPLLDPASSLCTCDRNSTWTRSNIAWRARLVVLVKIVILRHILELLSVVIRGSNQINCKWFDDAPAT